MTRAGARLALLAALLLWPATATGQGAPSPALASYVQGLDALRQGRYRRRPRP